MSSSHDVVMNWNKFAPREAFKKNKPLQGMAPTECTPSASLLPCLLAFLPACLLS